MKKRAVTFANKIRLNPRDSIPILEFTQSLFCNRYTVPVISIPILEFTQSLFCNRYTVPVIQYTYFANASWGQALQLTGPFVTLVECKA